MTTNDPVEQRWEQPTFEPTHAEQPSYESSWAGEYAPGYTGQFAGGPVLLPATRVEVPPPSVEERRLSLVRALIWPVAIILCILARTWLPLLIVPLVVGGVVRRRLHELRRQRLMLASSLR